jgi:hypothetical protein
MRSRIYIALIGVCLALFPSPARADRPVKVVENVCDRFTHTAKSMRGTDLLDIRVVRIDGKHADITLIDGTDGARAYGYKSNVALTIWSPSRRNVGRSRLRFASMDRRCHRVEVRYRIVRFKPGTSPYA